MSKKTDLIENILEEGFLQNLMNGQFFLRYLRSIFIGIAVFVFVLILMNSFITSSKANAEKDYLSAAAESGRLEEAGEARERALEILQEVLSRRTELHPRYDGLLLANMLERGELSLAKDYADLVFSRVGEELEEFYGEYSKTSLLIYEEKKEEALLRAKKLRTNLNHFQENKGIEGLASLEVLSFYNLLRIAFLEQNVGNKESELLVWGEILSELNQKNDVENTRDRSYIKDVLSTFSDGNVTLEQYIQHRKKILENLI